jgi:hypothetical protein
MPDERQGAEYQLARADDRLYLLLLPLPACPSPFLSILFLLALRLLTNLSHRHQLRPQLAQLGPTAFLNPIAKTYGWWLGGSTTGSTRMCWSRMSGYFHSSHLPFVPSPSFAPYHSSSLLLHMINIQTSLHLLLRSRCAFCFTSPLVSLLKTRTDDDAPHSLLPDHERHGRRDERVVPRWAGETVVGWSTNEFPFSYSTTAADALTLQRRRATSSRPRTCGTPRGRRTSKGPRWSCE